MTWIRVEANAGRNDKVHLLASRLRISQAAALGHAVMLWGGVAEFRVDGNLSGVLDHTLEAWAGWTGKRGRFAAEFRKLFVASDGMLTGWTERQGKLIERAAAERARKFRGRSADNPPLRNDTIRNEEKASVPTEPGEPEQAKPARPDPMGYRTLFPLIRKTLWRPDGKCPERVANDAWSEDREGDVIQALRKHYSVSDLEVVIQGLGHMVRGLAESERPSWLPVGSKVSLRAVYHTRSGVTQMVELCRRAYWQVANKSGKKRGGVSDVSSALDVA